VKVLRYNDWRDTALSLHLILQMMGKVKLARMEPQPEWNHILLQVTTDGFTTGMIPNGDRSFSIEMQIRESKVTVSGLDGRDSSFALREGTSTGEYYEEFKRILADVMCETQIYTVPQEMSLVTPFETDSEKRDYDANAALEFHRMCCFAYAEILKFVAPFRGKRTLPSFFWGTFDVTSVLYSGKDTPFGGEGVIERTAFDEQLMEIGFWPGDDKVADPSFFILAYPFLTEDYSGAGILPDKAFFSAEKAEFFFRLADALSYDDPSAALQSFFRSGYDAIVKGEGWANTEWLNKPLLIDKGSSKLR
jgi:hypothetical protein